MKYNLLKKVEQVVDFELLHNFAIINGEIINIITNEQIDKIENQRNIYNFGDNLIISKDIRGNSFILNALSFEIGGKFKIDAENFPFFTFYEIDNESIEGVYHCLQNKILFETTEWIGRDIIKDYIFSDSGSLITSRSILTGKIIWQFDLTQLSKQKIITRLYSFNEPYKVLKFIGILENKIWIALNHYTLIAIDIQSGKILHQISEIENFNYPFGNIIPAPESMKIDSERKILYALSWEYYWEINAETGEIEIWDLLDYFKSLKLRNDLILNYTKVENIIYFVSRNDNCNYESQLAGFDVNTKKIVWQYKFTPNEEGKIPQINDLKVKNKRLGALDKGGTLHLFEQE